MSDSTSMLVRSPHLSTFGHMGEVYLYHDLYGMILKMSPDVLEVLDAFEAPTDPDVVAADLAAGDWVLGWRWVGVRARTRDSASAPPRTAR